MTDKARKKGIQITRYKVTTWGNKETGERMYGVAAYSSEHGWMNVCDGKRACIFGTPTEARAEIVSMKEQRDADGYKIVKDAA